MTTVLGMYRCDGDYCLDVPFVTKMPCARCGREFVSFTHTHVLRTGMQYTISGGHVCEEAAVPA